jgi:hypothetical protein
MDQFIKEMKAEGWTEQQARTVWCWMQSGAELIGIHKDGNVDMSRMVTSEQSERFYVTREGIVKKSIN